MSHIQLNVLFTLTRKHRFSQSDLEQAVALALPDLSPAEIKALRAELQEMMCDIEDYFKTLVDPANLHRIPEGELKAWLADSYPWMDTDTLDGAYKEGLARAAV